MRQNRTLTVLIPLLASLTATAGEAGPGGDAGTTPPQPGAGAGAAAPADAMTPEQRKFWDELQSDPKVAASQVAAEAKYVEALAAYRAARFLEARELVEQAIQAYPPHQGAQALRQEVLAILSLRENRLQQAATWAHDIQDVKTQEMAVRTARLLESGDKKMTSGDYDGAFLDYDAVEVALRTFPYQFDWGDLPEKVAVKKLEARAQSRQAQLERTREDRRKAEREAERRTAEQESALRQKVDEMLRRARVAFDRKDYKRAEVDAWNAYELDRRRDDARTLYLDARAKGHRQFDDQYREDRLELLARVHEEIHKDLIPQSELLVYPEDWKRRSMRKAPTLGNAKVEPWQEEIARRMEQRVTFEFEDTAFEDVVNFFRQVTGINIVVDAAVYAAGGATPVTLRARDMRFKEALSWVMRLTGLHSATQSQAIFISKDAIAGSVNLRLYDVADIVMKIPDFPGRELAYNAAAGGAGGGGGGGFDLFKDAGGGAGGAASPTSIDAAQLVEFIQRNVRPDSWQIQGVGIDIRSGSTLFVSQTPEVHDLIQTLINSMRAQARLTVHMQVRILDVRKNFFEEIGFEYHDLPPGLLDATNNGDPAVSGYRRLNWTESYDGTVRHQLPANGTVAAYTAGSNGVYTRGLQVEGSWNINNFFSTDQVNVIFAAVEEEGDAQILQAPSITCFNGQRANASFINQYAYISDYEVVNSGLDPVISILNYGEIIDVRPIVSSDHKYITMEVRPTSVILEGVFIETLIAPRVFNSGGVAGFFGFAAYPLELPNIAVRTLRSTVVMPDKGTLMLGGFVRALRQRTHSGVPFLSHIPFLGRLFSRNGVYDENRRLFFLLTGEIVDLEEKESLQ